MVEATPVTQQKPELLLLYGSETGNCEQISESLQETLNADATFSQSLQKREVQRFSLNEYQKSKFTNKNCLKIVVFICSSTGDGESPENAQQFFRYLRRETANVSDDCQGTQLSHIYYTILGLGDTNYSKFQGAPRYLDARVKMLGATCFKPRTEADEATSLEIFIEPWLESIQEELVQ